MRLIFFCMLSMIFSSVSIQAHSGCYYVELDYLFLQANMGDLQVAGCVSQFLR